MAPPISLLRSTYFLTDVSKKASNSSTDSGRGSSAGLGGEIVDAAATAAAAGARVADLGESVPDAVVLRVVAELLPFSFGAAAPAESSKAGVTKSSNLDVAASNLFASLISLPFILVVQIGLLVILNGRRRSESVV